MGRRFTAAERHAAKLRAVTLRAEGRTHAEIAKLTGLSRPTVADALCRHAHGGDAALAPARSGRKRGTGRLLSSERELQVREALRDSDPRDHGIAARRWTAAAIKTLIEQWFPRAQIGKQPEMSLRTVRRNLARWTQTRPAATAAIATVISGDVRATAREAEAMALWELLGWYPGPTGTLAALAHGLSSSPWIGQGLFKGFRQPWNIRRGCVSAQSLDLDYRLKTAAVDSAPAALRSDGKPFLHRHRKAMVARLWTSNNRRQLLNEELATDDRPEARHWSLRIFPVRVVEVGPARTPTRRVGRTDDRSQLRRAVFVGQLELRSGWMTAILLDMPVEVEDAEDTLTPRVLRVLQPIISSSARPADVHVHLPIGYVDDFLYSQVAKWADERGLRVQEDMLPMRFLLVEPIAVHHQLARRAGGHVKVLKPSCSGRVWGDDSA